MECYCDFDPPSVYNKTTPIARKEHSCYECGGTIMKGDKYQNAFGVWDGDASTFKTCSMCLNLMCFIEDNVPCVCWEHGNIHEISTETAKEYGEQGDGLLFGTYRRIVAIDKHKRNQPTATTQ